MSKLDEGVHEVVMKYMKVQNRPYSVQNVFDNLRGDVPKAKVSLALEAGVESGACVVKSYGAQKIYCIKQSLENPEATSESSTDLLKSKLNAKSVELAEAKANLDTTVKELQFLEQVESTRLAKEKTIVKRDMLKTQVEEQKVSRCENATNVIVSSDDLEEQISLLKKEFSTRKRIGCEMISLISEQSGMSRQEVVEDLGL